MALDSAGKEFLLMTEIEKKVAIGVVEAQARILCEQFRVWRLDSSMLDQQTFMTLACLAEQLRRVVPEMVR